MVKLGSFVFVEFLNCKEKSYLWFLLMLIWSWINALLASKRGPFEVLLTPFKTLIRHLLLRYCGTVWFSDSYECKRIVLFSSKEVCFREDFCIVFSASFVVCWDLLKQITDAQSCIRINFTENYNKVTVYFSLFISVELVVKLCWYWLVLGYLFFVSIATSNVDKSL